LKNRLNKHWLQEPAPAVDVICMGVGLYSVRRAHISHIKLIISKITSKLKYGCKFYYIEVTISEFWTDSEVKVKWGSNDLFCLLQLVRYKLL